MSQVSKLFMLSSCSILLFLAACAPPTIAAEMSTDVPTEVATHPPLDPTYEAMILEQRSPDVPELPFPDNPDPTVCGIPTQWGLDTKAWLTGFYEDQLIQETVLLYDSHLRLDISATAPHGAEVEIILYQQNPVTDYYLVKVVGAETPNEGWIPAPLLSFEPVEPLN